MQCWCWLEAAMPCCLHWNWPKAPAHHLLKVVHVQQVVLARRHQRHGNLQQQGPLRSNTAGPGRQAQGRRQAQVQQPPVCCCHQCAVVATDTEHAHTHTLRTGEATWCPVSSTSITRAAKWKGKSEAKAVISQEEACGRRGGSDRQPHVKQHGWMLWLPHAACSAAACRSASSA